MLSLFVLCSLVAAGAASVDNSTLYRLPKNVLPESYDILLLTNVTRGDFAYEGRVVLEFKVVNETNKVILHADKLNVKKDKSTCRDADQEEVKILNQTYDKETQFFTIEFSGNLKNGTYFLTLYFDGEVLNDVFGFYRSSYKIGEEKRWIGVTQFSPTYARRAFPCMDEPGLKATFQMSIGHNKNETVSFNTNKVSQNISSEPDYVITNFARTPRMPTYVLGWAIHDFNLTNSSDPRIRLWSRLSNLTSSILLKEGPQIYAALESWMGIPNPVEKIEQLAVPDFNFGAMENWGLITFREAYAETNMSTKVEHGVVFTMSHEYTHTWFGNLVTPEFWNYAWLKEGFASYFGYYIMNLVHPDWNTMDLFPVEQLQNALLQDSATHNRTMNGKNVGSPKSAKGALDFVTYNKGASIIRMISDFVGEDVFKNALQMYLKERQFEAATPSDLYKRFDAALKNSSQPSKLPTSIDQIVESWTNQPNYPVINIYQRDPNSMVFTQRPFLLNDTAPPASVSRNSSWWVPIKIMMQPLQGGKPKLLTSTWLKPNNSMVLVYPDVSDISWYLANPNQTGYYRVNYDVQNWQTLIDVLDSSNYELIPKVSRAALIDDAFNLARAAHLKDYLLPLKISKYLFKEKEYEPWIAATRAFTLLHKKLRDRPDVQLAFERYAINLMGPIFTELREFDEPSDSHIRKMHRNLILNTACSLNLEDCVARAKLIFDSWINRRSKILPANIKSFVYRAGVVRGTNEDWTKLWNKFLKADLHSEKELMFNALAQTENTTSLEILLNFAIQPDSDIPKQYRMPIFKAVIDGSSKNVDAMIDYIQHHLATIIKHQGIDFLRGIFSTIGQEITSKLQIEKLSKFTEENQKELNMVGVSTKEAIKSATNNIAWIDRAADEIWLYLNLHQR